MRGRGGREKRYFFVLDDDDERQREGGPGSMEEEGPSLPFGLLRRSLPLSPLSDSFNLPRPFPPPPPPRSSFEFGYFFIAWRE